MIANTTVIFFIISLILTTVFPIILLLCLCIKKKISTAPMFMGVAAFFVSQVVLRMPIMNVLSTFDWYKNFVQNNEMFYFIVIGGLTAALFEESARLVGAKSLRDKRTYKDAVSFGVGHASCEVIFILGLTNINNVILSLQLNGGDSAVIATLTENGIAQAMASATPLMICLGLFERLPAIAFHVFATLLVFKGVREHKIKYYFLAVLAHTSFNALASIFAKYFGVVYSEALLAAFGVLAMICIFKIKPSFDRKE